MNEIQHRATPPAALCLSSSNASSRSAAFSQLLKQALCALIVFTIMTANSEDRDRHTYVPKSQRPAANSRRKEYFAALKPRLKVVTLWLEQQVDNLQTRNYRRYKKKTRHPRDFQWSFNPRGFPRCNISTVATCVLRGASPV